MSTDPGEQARLPALGNGDIPVTVLVQTKNEEEGLASCLGQLTGFAEVIVVDSDSADRTKAIAQKCGAAVVNFTWNGQYPKKKQWQLDRLRTKHDWVLFLDADESPSAELLHELRDTSFWARLTEAAAVDISLSYVFAGKELRHGHRVVKRALVHRKRVKFPVVDDLAAPGMGELEGHYQPIPILGDVLRAHGRLHHDDKDPVRTWFDRHNKYSDWEAFLRARPATRDYVASARTTRGRLFDRMPFKPLIFFLYAYVFRLGFVDGRAGFDYAFALAGYYWQIGLKTRELGRTSGTEHV